MLNKYFKEDEAVDSNYPAHSLCIEDSSSDEKSDMQNEVSLSSLAKIEKKLKRLEQCQNLQSNLLLNKLDIEKDEAQTSKKVDVFISNKNDSILDNILDISFNTKDKKNGKWTLEEVIKILICRMNFSNR